MSKNPLQAPSWEEISKFQNMSLFYNKNKALLLERKKKDSNNKNAMYQL